MGVVTGGGGGGAAFNGGTITNPLDIEITNPAALPLNIVGPASSTNDLADFATAVGGGVIIGTAGQVQIVPDANQISLIVNATAASGLFSSITEWQSGLGATLSRIMAVGAFSTAVHAAPADADLAAGECSLWFDQTNGAAKLMVKGKSANGTVVAAAIALA